MRGKTTLVVFFLTLPVQAQYGGGIGAPNDPYLIYTAEQMNEIGLHKEDQHKHFKLMADIDLSAYSGTAFNMIGVTDRAFPGFIGVFDGDGHTISNFTYTSTYSGSVGIFASIWGPNARINNLGLIDPNIDAGAGSSVGPLAGRLEMGTIINCYVVGGKVSGKRCVGGLVGNNDGHVTNCFSDCTIHAEEMVGGLVEKMKALLWLLIHLPASKGKTRWVALWEEIPIPVRLSTVMPREMFSAKGTSAAS